ncbi:MAG: Fe-S cluster assembly ATPase SufC [Victivallaceae bacterium]
MLEIEHLHVVCNDGPEILKNLNLRINPGEKHVIMGPNGAGKSTLAKILLGDPGLEVSSGHISFYGSDLSEQATEERVGAGLFVSFQNPPEIAGLVGNTLLFESLNHIRAFRNEPVLTRSEFQVRLSDMKKHYGFKETDALLERSFNQGCSGGEKKKHELLQMLILQPALTVLDELDSGLDVDAMKFVCDSLNKYYEDEPEKSLIFITHYPQMAQQINPDYVHVLNEGAIVLTGGQELIMRLESEGYERLIISSCVSAD